MTAFEKRFSKYATALSGEEDANKNRDITIDGSRGEGGGQILRNAMAFATILFQNHARPKEAGLGSEARQRLRIHKIRAGRSNPGLRAQHLIGIQLAVDIAGSSSGGLIGGSINSTEISYESSRSQPPLNTSSTERHFTGDTGTAGSIVLLLQAALPTALFAGGNSLDSSTNVTSTRLTLKGGTNASMAPQYDYWERVFWPTLQEQCGLEPHQVQARVIQRGFYPRGGGQVEVTILPMQQCRPLQPIQLNRDQGGVAKFYIRSFHAGNNLRRHLAEQMAQAAQATLLAQHPDVPIEIDVVKERNVVGSGLGILVTATTTTGCRLAGSALGHPKTMTAQQAGVAAAQELLQSLQDGGCVDEWLQDQLIVFMALAEGTSEMVTGSLTLHTRTAIWISEEMTSAFGENGGAKFEVVHLESQRSVPTGVPDTATNAADYGKDGRMTGRHLIRCNGIGYSSRAQGVDGHRDKIQRKI